MIAHLIQDPKVVNYVENPAKGVPIDGPGQLTKLASTFSDVDGLFYFTYVVCIFFFVLITAVLAYSVVKYRRKTFDQPAASNVTHNTPLEVIWTVIPLIIVMIMFAWGWKGSLDMTVAPEDARQYKAVASQWSWAFTYPDNTESYNELWLEVGKPAAFTLESRDVLHAFFIPSMRTKRDIIPGRLGVVWFQPTEIGEYDLFCAEYCGQDHSKMHSLVHVVSPGEYEKKPWNKIDMSTPEAIVATGSKLYSQLTCNSCHTVNGAALTGPTWKGLFKKEGGQIVGCTQEVQLADGSRTTITIDDKYIVESIRDPGAKKRLDMLNQNMTAFATLDDNRIQCLIAYMKSLAEGN